MTERTLGWYPDPFGRYDHRYWDGVQWTGQVATRGTEGLDPVEAGAPGGVSSDTLGFALPAGRSDRRVRKLARSAGLDPERTVVVRRTLKRFHSKPRYEVFNGHGQKTATVGELGWSFNGPKFARQAQISDLNGLALLVVEFPARLGRTRVTVAGADGTVRGQIAQESRGVFAPLFGKRFYSRFRLEAAGAPIGTINAEDEHDRDFTVRDSADAEVARILVPGSRTPERVDRVEHFMVSIPQRLREPLRSLVLSTPFALDAAFPWAGRSYGGGDGGGFDGDSE